MRIKSYYAATVESAMTQARQEFGSEAMLMSSKRTTAEARHLGEYEVVFACPNGPAEGPERIETRAPAVQPTDSGRDNLLDQISDLRVQLEAITSGARRAGVLTNSNVLNDAGYANLFSRLLAAEVDAVVANNVVSALRAKAPGNSRDGSIALRDEVERVVSTDSTLGKSAGNRVVALVGPPGAGKTSTLVKIAVAFGLSAKRTTQFITIDCERVGAANQLHTLAGLIGAGFRYVESTATLAQALQESRPRDLVLIDTPGFGPRDVDACGGLAAFFSDRSDIDVHLVLPASMRSIDLAAAADRFSTFKPDKLLFTRLDETRCFGPMLNESVRLAKPVSFLTTGQRIPEDFEVASKPRIAGLILGDITAKSTVAAA